ncbi:MAG: hypothetical protein DMF74_16075 [Acidobacteria bacterium]|nr:MAG: hypothetical protein DMF74_16075 [Acidobacteriota bacterium]
MNDVGIDHCAASLVHEKQKRRRQNQLSETDGVLVEAKKGSEDETNQAHQRETEARARAQTRSERRVLVIGVSEKRAARDGDEG